MTSSNNRPAMKRGSAAQVVLLPGGPVGDALLDVVEAWTHEGLLDPVFWVPAHLVLEHHSMPARMSAYVFGRNAARTQERREVPLLATLGRESLDELIVSSVRWLTGDSGERDFVSQSARRMLTAIRDAMPLPRQVGDVAVGGTRVRSLNLIFASTRVTSDEIAALVSRDWEENILVSPEDRQRPNAADRFTDADDTNTWAGFVAASTASLAGLWTGFSTSPVPPPSVAGAAVQRPQVRVARTFSRAVVSGGFSIDLAQSVAAALAAPKTPLTDPLVASQIQGLVALDGEQAETTIGQAVDALMRADSAALSYKGLGALPTPEPMSVGFFRSVGDFLSFSWDKISSIPACSWGWVAAKLGGSTKRNLYADSEAVEVDARRDLGILREDPDLLDTAHAIQTLQTQVGVALRQPPLPVTRQPLPTLWSALRATVFVLVDGGSDHSDLSPVMQQGRIAVVPDVGMVVPAPWDTWKLPTDVAKLFTGDESNETAVTWTELPEARELLAHLEERTSDLKDREAELETKYRRTRSELIAAERDFVEAKQLLEDLLVELDETEEVLELAKGVRSDA